MEKNIIILSEKDNVATVISKLVKKGDVVNCNTKKVKVLEDILFGHKVALIDIKKGDYIKKYGEAIGKATKNIRMGEYVHTHNVESLV
jgi:predicted lipoprotein